MQPTDTVTVLKGGREILISKNDGTTEKVFIRQVSYFELPQLVEAFRDDFAAARLYTEMEEKDLAEVTADSVIDILDVGEEINAAAVDKFLERTKKKLEGETFQKLNELNSISISSLKESLGTQSAEQVLNGSNSPTST